MTSAYTINLNPNITTPVKTGYTFKAGDKGITFNIAVTEMDPTGTSAKIAFHRANGTSVEASLTGGGPNYSYTILGNEFAVPGVVVADVKFYQSTTQRVSTASFVFNVINDTLDGLGGGTAGYSDELETLSAAMEGYIEAFGNLSPINPRGAYNASTAYEPADCVSYNSNSWLCIQPCTGVTPSEGAYWQQVADMATGKADKVNGATNGNFAGLDASGNLTDSGVSSALISALGETILLGSTSASSSTTISVSMELSMFRSLLIQAENANGGLFISSLVPIKIFKQKTGGANPIAFYFYDGAKNNRIILYYVNDSSIQAMIENNYILKIYGII